MDIGDVYRRASGRRKINSQRRKAADDRRAAILKLVDDLWREGIPAERHKAEISVRMGITLRTVQRHFRLLMVKAPEHRCPLCGHSIRLGYAGGPDV